MGQPRPSRAAAARLPMSSRPKPPQPHSTDLKHLLLLAGALLAVATAVSGCKSESAPYVAPPQPVRAAAVTLTAAAETRSYTGTIKPRYESDLGFRVSGKIV